MKKVCLIVNPVASGMKKIKRNQLISQFPDSEYIVSLVETKYKKHASQLTQDAIDSGFKTIVCVGGEGTLHEIAQVASFYEDVQIGIIPNAHKFTVAHQFGIPVDIEKAINIIKQGNSKKMDLFEINTDDGRNIFVTSFFGIGLSAAVAKQLKMGKTYHLNYMFKLFRELFLFVPKSFSVSYNFSNQTICSSEYIITNSKGYSTHMSYCPQASNKDGIIDIVRFENIGKWRLFGIALKGLLRVTDELLDVVEYEKTEFVQINFTEEMDVHVDFEHYKFKGNVEVSIKGGGLNIICP